MSENESYGASHSEGEGNESLEVGNGSEAFEWIESSEDGNVTEPFAWIESFRASHEECEGNESLGDGHAPEAVDWLEVGLGAVEVGLAEGSLLGRVELHRLNAQNGMYKGLEIAAGLE